MPRVSTTKNLDKFESILKRVKQIFPNVKFVESDVSSWNFKHKCIYYNKKSATALEDLLHEIGHMKSNHQEYLSDLELLRYESDAWEIAQSMADKIGIEIDENYINKCMETYRLWVYKRSLCPQCNQVGIEISEKKYKCINCSHKWQVGSNQKNRIYKKTS